MNRSFQFKVYLVLIFLVTGFTRLSVRLFEVHHAGTDEMEEEAFSARMEETVIDAPRGRILDRNKEILAISSPHYELVADRYHLVDEAQAATAVAYDRLSSLASWQRLDDKNKIAKIKREAMQLRRIMSKGYLMHQNLALSFGLLSTILNVSARDLEKKFAENCSDSNVRVASELNHSQKNAIEAMIKEKRLRGFRIVETYKRFYPNGDKACHLIGCIQEDSSLKDVKNAVKALNGIEYSFNEKLSGRNGSRKVWINRHGIVDYNIKPEISDAVAGNDICLTIDSSIQAIVENELSQCVERYKPENVAIVVMDPRQGDILAIASYPRYDLNTRQGSQYDFAKNGKYEPGSTFKSVAFAAAFDERVIKNDDLIDCENGSFRYSDQEYREKHSHGVLPAKLVLAKSSNIGTFKVALKLDQKDPLQTYIKYAKKFGFEIKNSSRSSFYNLTHGYSLFVSPLQIATFYSMIANDGKMTLPRFVLCQITPANELVEMPIESRGSVISPEAAIETREALKIVVSDGTAKRASVEGYSVAGKTGTATLWNSELNRYDDHRFCSSFVGMMPADDPRFVCAVVVRAPKQTTHDESLDGGVVAAPVFAEIAKKISKYMNMKPSLGDELKAKKQP